MQPRNGAEEALGWQYDEFTKEPIGFDVTCVIGRVQLDAHGEKPAHVAAFELIALHDAEGEFSFPMTDGRVCHVDVNFEAR